MPPSLTMNVAFISFLGKGSGEELFLCRPFWRRGKYDPEGGARRAKWSFLALCCCCSLWVGSTCLNRGKFLLVLMKSSENSCTEWVRRLVSSQHYTACLPIMITFIRWLSSIWWPVLSMSISNCDSSLFSGLSYGLWGRWLWLAFMEGLSEAGMMTLEMVPQDHGPGPGLYNIPEMAKLYRQSTD